MFGLTEIQCANKAVQNGRSHKDAISTSALNAELMVLAIDSLTVTTPKIWPGPNDIPQKSVNYLKHPQHETPINWAMKTICISFVICFALCGIFAIPQAQREAQMRAHILELQKNNEALQRRNEAMRKLTWRSLIVAGRKLPH